MERDGRDVDFTMGVVAVTFREFISFRWLFGKRKTDKTDHFPAGRDDECRAAYAAAEREVARMIGRNVVKTMGWSVVIVPGEDSPYGKAIRCEASPTGWAGAVTRAMRTQVVECRCTRGTLVHEAGWAVSYQNGCFEQLLKRGGL